MHQPTQSSQQTNQVEEVENYGKTPHHTSQLITLFNRLYRLLKTVRFSQQAFLDIRKKIMRRKCSFKRNPPFDCCSRIRFRNQLLAFAKFE